MKPYYDDGQVTIYHGDCREVVAHLDTSDAVFVTDPPYGVGKDYGDGLTDDLATCVPLWQWLIDQARPTCFTFSHTRLFDLPVRPQWIGAWVKPFTSGIMWIGASPTWEPVCFYHLPNQATGRPRWDDVFTFHVQGFPFDKPREFDHPAPRPVALMRKLITLMPSGVVVDPFMGTGTTMRAAMDLGVRAIGIEQEERYCEMAVGRLLQLSLLTSGVG